MLPYLRYLPSDRLTALVKDETLPQSDTGSALFADISGFTTLTERLDHLLGARQGAEALAGHLNRIYSVLIGEINRYGGATIGFSGDAILCWFHGDSAPERSTACALALQAALQTFAGIDLPDGNVVSMGLKVAIASGSASRYLVGDPGEQWIETLAGQTVERTAVGEQLAARGDVIADAATVTALGDAIEIKEWRIDASGARFAVLGQFSGAIDLPAPADFDSSHLSLDQIRPWVLPNVFAHLQEGLGEYLTELRPAVALFIRFSGIDYETDAQAGERLDQFVRRVQQIVTRFGGSILQLTIGDKGSYLYAAFGAPLGHEDDAARAVSAALELRSADFGLAPLQIGLSRGTMRTGAYGSETRRTYGVLGDEVNVAARLMQAAEPGAILISEAMTIVVRDDFQLETLPPLTLKGKQQPMQIHRVIGRSDTFERTFYTSPLIGREQELKTLLDAVQPIFAGHSAGVITIYGEAGMGKSRLVHEFQQRIAQSVTWLTGQSDDIQHIPLQPFSYFLRPYFGQRREQSYVDNLARFDTALDGLIAATEDEILRRDLALYRSFLANLIGLSIPGSLFEQGDGSLRLNNTIAGIKALIRAECLKQPVILHIEDAHWLDEASIAVIRNLTYNMEVAPLALVLTSRYRDDDTPFTIPDLGDVPQPIVNLNHLSENGVQSLAQVVLNESVSPALTRFIHGKAEGNPFFTEQLALDLRERGLLRPTEAGLDLTPTAATEVPVGINSILIARLDRLAAQVKAVVQTAAVLGREFDLRILSQMLRQDDEHSVREAEREAIWSALDQFRYLFRHALLRDAAYEMQLQARLKELHQVAAEAIEVLYPNDETQLYALADHWHAARDADRALPYIVRAADRLIEVTADYSWAARLVERGLAYHRPEYEAELLKLRGDSLYLRGQFSEAQTDFRTSLAATDDQRLQVQSLVRLAETDWRLGDLTQAAHYGQQALTLAQAVDPLLVASVLQCLGVITQDQGDLDGARAQLERGLTIYREHNQRSGVALALNNLANVSADHGDYVRARDYFEESRVIRAALGDRWGVSMSSKNLGTMAIILGEPEVARPYFLEALQFDRELGSEDNVGYDLNNLGNIFYAQGSYDQASDYLADGLRIRRKVGDRRGIAMSLNNLGNLASTRGQHPAAHEYYGESLSIRREMGDRHGIAMSLNNLGNLAFMERDYSTARQHYADSLSIEREIGNDNGRIEAQANLAVIQAQLGLLDEARAALIELVRASPASMTRPRLAQVILNGAYLAFADGQAETAARWTDSVIASRQLEPRYLPFLYRLQGELRATLNADALAQGQTLTTEDVIAQMLALWAGK